VLFWQARQAFNEERYADAERDFGIFLQRYPKDPDAESAVLWAGRAAARRQEYLGAIEHFTTLIKEFPQGARLAEARLEQGNALSALAKFSEAILVYQELVTRYPESDAVAETWLRIGDCQFMLGQDDSARYTSAMQAYRAAINSPHDGLGLDLQAEYKIGRCLQKLERPEEAIHQFYKRVMLRFLEAGEKGQPQTEAARMWFGLASRDAADILEQSGEWRKLVSILERAVDAGVPGEAGFRERIRNIRSQHWWLFY
jgi:tol-pal system protein YbgF